MAYNKIKEEIATHVDADDYKLFYIHSYDEIKTVDMIKELAKERDLTVYVYDNVDGLRVIQKEDKRLKNLSKDSLKGVDFALEWLKDNAKGFFVFLTPGLFNVDQAVTRAFKNFITDIIEKSLLLKVFFISPSYNIPEELKLELFHLDFPLPDRDEIEEIFNSIMNNAGFFIADNLKEQFVNALQGLRESDIVNIIKFLLYKGEINLDDIESILAIKSQLIKKDSLLEFVMVKETLSDVGGMKKFKEWSDKKGIVFQNLKGAIEYKVDIPKGVLLFGMPGCGKSLVAKALAFTWKLPLLRLDMGLILGPYVGQSEENIRRAVAIAESIAPCVLWIDELEKGFAGIKGEGGSSDVMRRVFGTFLTWMQEKTEPVFVIATANDISGIPPEFLRKGRFDEIFYVDFPNDDAINDIIKIHLRKRNKEEWYNTILEYKPKFKGYSGADIEALISELVERNFVASIKNETFNLKTELDDIMKTFKPLSMVMKKKIDVMKEALKEIDAKNVD